MSQCLHLLYGSSTVCSFRCHTKLLLNVSVCFECFRICVYSLLLQTSNKKNIVSMTAFVSFFPCVNSFLDPKIYFQGKSFFTAVEFICFLPCVYYMVLHKITIQRKMLTTMAALKCIFSCVYFHMFLKSTYFIKLHSFIMNNLREMKTDKKIDFRILLTLYIFLNMVQLFVFEWFALG